MEWRTIFFAYEEEYLRIQAQHEQFYWEAKMEYQLGLLLLKIGEKKNDPDLIARSEDYFSRIALRIDPECTPILLARATTSE